MQPSSKSVLRYDAVTISLHWLTVILIVVLWTLGQTIDFFPRGAPRVDARSVHIVLGVSLGVVWCIRLIWRLSAGRHLPPATTGLLQIAATGVHWLLYAGIAAAVTTGIIFAAARGDDFFGLFKLPQLIILDQASRHNLGELHDKFATGLLILAGLHALAALFHHYVRHDDTLRRMLRGAR